MSGHSKWSQIKYKKAIEDAKKAKIFSKISRLITLAAREGGGDPEKNSDLKSAIEKAKDVNMPQDKIERSIKRGTGELQGDKLESLLLEALGPGGVNILIEVLTDNKNRALSEIRKIVENFGGKIASGGVLWNFEKKGLILVKTTKEDKENLELLLIDLGAEEVIEKNDFLEAYISPQNLEELKNGLVENKIAIEKHSIEFVPKERIKLNNKETEKKNKEMFETLDENDDVQEIYSNLEE